MDDKEMISNLADEVYKLSQSCLDECEFRQAVIKLKLLDRLMGR